MEIVSHLEKIFGIPLRDSLRKYSGERFADIKKEDLFRDLMLEKDRIFEHAEGCRKGYLKYIDTLNLEQYQSIYMVDLVVQGSSRYGLSSLSGREVKLLALGTTALPNMFVNNTELADSMYPQLVTGIGGAVSTMFNLLELVYGSKDGQLMGFTGSGEPIFNDATRYNSGLLDQVQNKILSFAESYIDKEWFLREYSSKFVEDMFGILHRDLSAVSEKVRRWFDFYDPLDEVAERYNVLDVVRGESMGR